jgi:hypothetical protein
VLPLRLVLTLGLIFFVVLKLSPTAVDTLTPPKADPGNRVLIAADDEVRDPGQAASAAQPAASDAEKRNVVIDFPKAWNEQLPPSMRHRLEATNQRARQNPEQELRRIGGQMLSMAPYAVLLSLPLFAGLLKLLYWRLPYGAHFVFAMHLHAAWYGILLLFVLLPWAWTPGAMGTWGMVYPLLALKRVHRAGWWSTVGRASLIFIMHSLLIILIVAALLLFGAVSSY